MQLSFAFATKQGLWAALLPPGLDRSSQVILILGGQMRRNSSSLEVSRVNVSVKSEDLLWWFKNLCRAANLNQHILVSYVRLKLKTDFSRKLQRFSSAADITFLLKPFSACALIINFYLIIVHGQKIYVDLWRLLTYRATGHYDARVRLQSSRDGTYGSINICLNRLIGRCSTSSDALRDFKQLYLKARYYMCQLIRPFWSRTRLLGTSDTDWTTWTDSRCYLSTTQAGQQPAPFSYIPFFLPLAIISSLQTKARAISED